MPMAAGNAPDGPRERAAASPARGGAAQLAAGRLAGLLSSVVDLHVRIALREVDRERRRLISGALLIGGGLTLVLLALIAAEAALLLWFHQGLGWSWIQAVLALASGDLVLAGVFLRVGGAMLQGPYLPDTVGGLTKTARALLGR